MPKAKPEPTETIDEKAARTLNENMENARLVMQDLVAKGLSPKEISFIGMMVAAETIAELEAPPQKAIFVFLNLIKTFQEKKRAIAATPQ